mmetsp:Transcript_16610/g.30837  ORF Transcript_16610/g.30837 Transcript_16610/m.30837 type:complete len:447 (-) Transcript_16610:37-1377(-)
METDAPLLRLSRALRAELGRAVFHELRHYAPSDQQGEAAEDIASLVRKANQGWDDVTAVSQASNARQLPAEWAEHLEAQYRRLTELTHELDNAEKSFEWSKVLHIRERDYISELAVRTLGQEAAEQQFGLKSPAPTGLPAVSFDEECYCEDLATMARIMGYLRAKDELSKLRSTFAEERTTLEEQLREAEQVRDDMKLKRRAELERLYEWMEAAGIPLEEEDFPAGGWPPQETDATDLFSRNADGWSVPIPKAQAQPSRGNSQRRRRRARQKSPGRSPRPKLHQGLAPFPPNPARTLARAGSPEALRHQDSAPGLPWATSFRRHMRVSSAKSRSARASVAGAQRQVSVPAPPEDAYRHRQSPLHTNKPWTPRKEVGQARKLVEQRVTADGYSVAGPGRQDLLLLGSSHRVVSEGAKDGALHFWLEPQSARPASVASTFDQAWQLYS